MAHATYDLADLCDDPEMLRAYVEIGGRWFLMADEALRAANASAAQPLDPAASDAADHPGASPRPGAAPGQGC
jgi:hypothetical protein